MQRKWTIVHKVFIKEMLFGVRSRMSLNAMLRSMNSTLEIGPWHNIKYKLKKIVWKMVYKY